MNCHIVSGNKPRTTMSLLGNIIGATGGLTGVPTGGLQSLLGQSADTGTTGPVGTGTNVNGQPYWLSGLANASQSVQDTAAQHADPGLSNGTAGGTTGGTGVYPGTAANNQRYLDTINHTLTDLPNQQAVGTGNINSTYQAALDQLLHQQSLNQVNHDTSVTNTTQDNILAKNNIDNGTRSQLTGIQRLLGAHGAGNSSAAQIFAPYAAGQQANAQRGQVQRTYDQNINGINNNWQQAQNDYTNSLSGLSADKGNKLQQLQQGLDQQQQQLLGYRDRLQGALGQAVDPNDVNTINSLQDQVTQLGKLNVATPAAVNYNAYKPNDYNYDASAAPVVNSANPNLAQSTGGYYNLINGDARKKLAGQSLTPAAA